jgi:hypothetical protein
MTKLNTDLKFFPLGMTKDGGVVLATNFWDLLTKLTPPGMVTGNDPDDYHGA